MSGFQHLSRTVHMPVSACGNAVRNNFGVVIAMAMDEATASAIADLINLGMMPAIEIEAAYELRVSKLSRMRAREARR